jgi:hemerythrin HHE cation binding domain-containing protein
MTVTTGTLSLTAPSSLRREHEELHADLARASQAPGRVGETAREVARLLHPHFLREDEFAMPPLALLAPLARGRVTPDMAAVLPLVARLKAEMPLMIEEHKAILAAVREFAAAAESEGDEAQVRFAADLMMHAIMEEEVLYPAAILVGEYVKRELR